MAADFSLRTNACGVRSSFTSRAWFLQGVDDESARAIARSSNLPDVLSRLLAARGVKPAEVDLALRPTIKRLLPEPNSLLDMERAVERMVAAITSDERIAIFGDYDVDGSCSAAMAHDYLVELGVRPRLYIPDRLTEGYGPSPAAMRRLRGEGASLALTVDCGANANEALDRAQKEGLDVIVLDHHAASGSSPAFAHVNPNRNGDSSGLGHLCAAGVVFLFLVAVNRRLRESGWLAAKGIDEPDLLRAADLVGLATVCDVVPLVGVNRAFVRAGLQQLDGLSRPGIAALAAIASISPPFSPYHLGFVFGPRINAGGRVGRCSLGVDLLTAREASRANEFALALDTHNRERQFVEKLMLEEAAALALSQDNSPFLFAAREDWHPGVVGIVAGRLKDRFGKPAFVAGYESGLARGSARSVAGVDIGAIVRDAKEAGLLIGGGGHAMAAGFSLSTDRLQDFTRFLSARFSDLAAPIDAPSLNVDALISPAGATEALATSIAAVGPFGAGNPEPVVAVSNMRVAYCEVLAREHLRLSLAGPDGARLDAIAFRAADMALGRNLLARRGGNIHVAGRLRADRWKGRTRVQLHIEDAAPADA